MPPKRKAAEQIAAPSKRPWYLVHAHLLEVNDPPVWRQLFVPSTIKLDKLHLLVHDFEVRAVDRREQHQPFPVVSTPLNLNGFVMPGMPDDFAPVHKTFDKKADMDEHKYMSRGMRNMPGAAMLGAKFGPFPKPPKCLTEKSTSIATLDRQYGLAANKKHFLVYQYDFGDGWEHLIAIEKVIPCEQAREIVQQETITAGRGHAVAEDCLGSFGWERLKRAYEVKDTPGDSREYREKREWYEGMCSNGDGEGLAQEGQIEFFDVSNANDEYQRIKARGPLNTGDY